MWGDHLILLSSKTVARGDFMDHPIIEMIFNLLEFLRKNSKSPKFIKIQQSTHPRKLLETLLLDTHLLRELLG